MAFPLPNAIAALNSARSPIPFAPIVTPWRGNYRAPEVIKAHAARAAAMDNPLWSQAMAHVITNFEPSGFFRWFDSGDLRSPLRPAQNLRTVRLSADLIDKPIPKSLLRSTGAHSVGLVVSDHSKATCLAHLQNNRCLSCRQCWSRSVKSVSYPLK